MSSIFFLNALGLNEYAFACLDSGLSAFESACGFAVESALADTVVVVIDDETDGLLQSVRDAFKSRIFSNQECSQKICFVRLNAFSAKDFFDCVAAHSKGFDTILVTYADAPFLDLDVTERLLEQHRKFKAEYSFVDGYPIGFAPEIMVGGLAPILSQLATGNSASSSNSPCLDLRYNRDFIFETVKKEINSFDIETLIAPDDFRHLRVQFFANSKRRVNVINVMHGITATNYAEILTERQEALFVLPAYYGLEIADKVLLDSCYVPKRLADFSAACMTKEQVLALVDKIVAYSDDAVISLSIFGDPVFHRNLEDIIEYILSHERLSILIETMGLEWTDQRLQKISDIVNHSKPRKNGYPPIYWIVALDAISSKQYQWVHSLDTPDAGTKANAGKLLQEASNFVQKLYNAFGTVVYPQFIRMNENEADLEPFFRFWQDKVKNVLIQKYSSFGGRLPDRRVADLSPLERHPCWHIKRDMYVLVDGTVVHWRGDIDKKEAVGKAFTEDFATIRERTFQYYKQQLDHSYRGICENCDEYYLYNF